jgi:succinyl-CoA:acetate CoA-transferase
MVNYGYLGQVDMAIVEAVAITEDGHLMLSCGVGNTPMFVKHARAVIVELNTHQPPELEGMHDIYIQEKPPHRTPIPILHPGDRIGVPFVACGLEKIACIVETDLPDRVRPLDPPNAKSERIAGHLIGFLKDEQKAGRLPEQLLPLQSGVGTIANSVLHGLIHSDFQHIRMYSEILQDAVFDLIDAGKLDMASGCAFTPSPSVMDRFRNDPETYRRRLILRPLDITNHPEVIRRLGVIAINTALEFDVYGNANSTHILGTQMMNGIGGSGDFMRNGYLTIFTTESTAKNDAVSRIVPMCSHVDSTEHDIHVLITEWGVADLRGLAPRERPRVIVGQCAHPLYRDRLLDYVERAERDGGHTPHLLEEALSWQINVKKHGMM